MQVPAPRSDVESIRALLEEGPSPTTSEWPETHAVDPLVEPTDRRPTPPAFVVPELPDEGCATLTVVRGVDAGRVFHLNRPRSIIGRGITADVQLDDASISRCHASVTRRANDRHIIEDLGSTNGTFVRGRLIGRTFLSPGDRIQLGPNVVFRFALLTEDEGKLQTELFESAIRDGLTGVLNRMALTKLADEAVRDAKGEGDSLSVLMIDLDHFKQVNDELGHAAGDTTLRAVAEQILRAVRARDSVARYGGEEFVVVARSTHRNEACRLAERLRAAIASLRVPTERGTAMTTASVGVASLAECQDHSVSALLRLADERMYEAKRMGRNCVWPS